MWPCVMAGAVTSNKTLLVHRFPNTPLERVCIGRRCTVRPARGQTQQQQMSDDEADEVGAKAADDYADEFADDDDYQFGKTSKKRKIEPLKNPGWCLVVKLTFKGIGGVMKFKDIFEPYADWIKHNEPTTLSYSYSTDDKDPKSVLLFERYADSDHRLPQDSQGVGRVQKVPPGPCGA